MSRRRSEHGGTGTLVLGVVLILLLAVAAFGWVESGRANAIRTRAAEALTAAVQSAARAPEDEQQAVFQGVLQANLGGSYQASLSVQPDALTGRLTLAYRLSYIGQWLPSLPLEMTHTEPVLKRKPRT